MAVLALADSDHSPAERAAAAVLRQSVTEKQSVNNGKAASKPSKASTARGTSL